MIQKLRFFHLVCLCLGLFVSIKTNSQPIDSAYSVNFLRQLIQYENYPRHEKPIFDHLSTWVQQKGLYFENLSEGDSLLNFITLLEPPCKKPLILFTAHMDIVFADTAGWKYAPYAGIVANGEIWGRGAIDDKGPLAMQLLALARYHTLHPTNELPFNVGVLAVSSEEIGGFGADYVMNNHLKRFNPVVIFGEGGSGITNVIPSKPGIPVFGISIAEKTPLWLLVEAKTHSRGHSFNAELYASKNLLKALVKIVDEPKKIKFHKVTRKMLNDLGEMEGGFKGFVIKNSSSWIFWPFTKNLFKEGGAFSSMVSDTYTITEINTISNTVNAVPQQAYAYIDCRLLPGTSMKLFLFKMRLKAGNKVVITPVMTGYDAKPSEVNEYFHLMAKSIRSVYPCSEVKPYLFPASSDNNTYRYAGYTTYGITPIIVSNELLETVHNTNERIPVESYLSGIETYFKFIENLNTLNVQK